ncbi:MAG: sulfotransferase [Gammaproteobacteria bacterium]|nr:sulfotransferase [Gammaproteobacteria bacterium]
MHMDDIPPVFVFSTGRCGSTMISEMLNRHPDILSLSEFFSVLGLNAFSGKKVTGDRMWQLYSRPGKRMAVVAQESFSELLYPFDDPGARFNADTLPPIMAVTLPHLTNRYEALYDEIRQFTCAQPEMLCRDHYRLLFSWLGERLGKKLWVERHGGSLIMASRLLRHFPEARVVHVFRDGRETTLSMSNHPPFRITLALIHRARRLGIDLCRLLERVEHSDRLTSMIGGSQWLLSDIGNLLSERPELSEVARFWSNMIETGHRVFGHFGPDRLLDLRFEDMQENSEREARRLIEFISPESDNEAWIREVARIPRQTRSRFALLDPDMQRAVTEACRPGLKILDYAM